MTFDGRYVVRDPEINRLLAREAVAAHKERRQPNFDTIVRRDASSINGLRFLTRYRIRKPRLINQNFDPTLN